MRTSGNGSKKVLLPGDRNRYPCSWSPDGQDLLFQQEETTGYSLWRFANVDRGSPTLLIPHTDGDCAYISPNGKRVAYVSRESGRAEVYVDSYPSLSEKIAVSRDGG